MSGASEAWAGLKSMGMCGGSRGLGITLGQGGRVGDLNGFHLALGDTVRTTCDVFPCSNARGREMVQAWGVDRAVGGDGRREAGRVARRLPQAPLQ